MKKAVSFFLLLCFLLPMIPAASAGPAPKPSFSDVGESDWFYAPVSAMCAEGVLQGKSDKIFDPLAPVTRAEFVTILSRVACVDVSGDEDLLSFRDTPKAAWYAPYVGWGASVGLVSGYPDNTFRPDVPVTRQELAALIVRFTSFMEATVRASDPASGFTDGDRIEPWAREYVEELRLTGLVRGDEAGRFNPSSSATRAEAATVFSRLLPFVPRVTVAAGGKSDLVIAGDLSAAGVTDAAERLNLQLGAVCGTDPLPVVETDAKESGRIILSLGAEGLGKNGYEISADGSDVTVSAETDEGLYRGVVRLVNDFSKGGDLRVSGKSCGAVPFAYPVGRITVKGHDISEYTIFRPAGMTDAARVSVEELSSYVAMACGAVLPIREGEPEGLAIIIDTSDPADPQSFSIVTEGDNIRIRGCDHALEDLGTHGNDSLGISFGIYTFLDEVIGVRFLTEKEDYVVPADRIEIGDLDIRESPGIRDRIIYWSDYLNSPRLKLRNRVADGIIWANGMACHTFDALDGDFSDQFESQPCLTDEAVYERVLGNVLSWLENNPDCNYISVSQNDNVHYCGCENCMRVVGEEGSQAGPIIRFVNRIAREVAKARPDVRIHTFAYAYSVDPPKITKPEPNVSVQLCSIDECFSHPLSGERVCRTNEPFAERIAEWAKISEELMIWDYTNNFAFRSCPFPNLSYEILAGNMRLFAESKTQYVFAQGNGYAGENGEFDHLRSYLLAKLAWDPYMSEEEYYSYMREYMTGFYGEGWESLYDALITMHTKRPLNCLGVFDSPAMISLNMRPFISDLLALSEDAKMRTESKEQFARADQTGIQFDYAWVETFFRKYYNSSDPADREMIVAKADALQKKMQKYRAKFSDAYPPPELTDITAPPSEWKDLMDEQMGLD